jgi:succinate dehydrogenase / fumarate reductase flavoprotein subunit
MGGIPTTIESRVTVDENNTVLPGLYAAGECACVSVHGANRLGTNSLLDILVFGRRAGRSMTEDVRASNGELPELPAAPAEQVRGEIEAIRTRSHGENAQHIRMELADAMMEDCGVFRTAASLNDMTRKLRDLRARYASVAVQDSGRVFNTELLEAREVGYLLDCAEATVAAALARTESRGGHYREDFPERDDGQWLQHSLAYRAEGGPNLRYKPVTITRFQPKPRTY